MEKEIILATAASYQDRDGTLTLSLRRLQWSVQGEKSPTIDTAISEIKNFFVGKPNVTEAKFRIKCTDHNNQEITHTLVLKSQSAWQDLEIIKAQVKNKGQGRSAAPSPAPQQSAASSPVYYKSAAPSPASGGSSPAVWNNNLQLNKNGTTTNGRNGTLPSRKEIGLRKNLLMRDKKLADQHKMLVVEQKCIAEEEFWELRKNLLRDQDTRTSQQKGRSSTMPNLRPVTEEGGEAKINITPQLINEIFEEYPRVKIAYDKNVPNKISEEAFWKRYVHSKFNDRNRGTTNTSNDDIFEKCWAETEDDLNQEREHGRKRLKISNLRDLSATKEDHMEIDFAPDITMRAGQGKILSLLRRNNRHGERILEASCEKSRKYKEATAQQKGEDYMEDIVMDELIEEETSNTYKLDITDQREYFASQASEIDNDVEMVDAEQNSIKHQSSIELLNKFRESFRNWNPNLTKSLFPKKVEPIPNSVTKACNGMIEDKQNRVRESKPKIENLPQKIEKEVNIIQLMGNEFLRHFWASVDSTVKEKVEKNKRMIEQLKSILTKIDQISELQPSDDDFKQGLITPNGVSNINTIQKDQRLDKEPRSVPVNGKRLKIGSRIGGSSSEQVGGNHIDSNGSPRIDSEWKDALIQAQQMLDPLYKAIVKALSHNQGVNVSRLNNRQGSSTISQNFQKSVRTSSPDHHRAVIRDSKTISSPDLHKAVPRDTKSTSPDIQRLTPWDSKQHGRTVNREAKQVVNSRIQKSSNHDMQQSSNSEVQKPSNRQIKQGANMRQDINRVNPKVPVRNGTAQVQTDVNRETNPSRTTIKIQKRNIQQNINRDELQSNGRDTLKSSNVTPSRVSSGSSGISSQASSANKIKTKRKR